MPLYRARVSQASMVLRKSDLSKNAGTRRRWLRAGRPLRPRPGATPSGHIGWERGRGRGRGRGVLVTRTRFHTQVASRAYSRLHLWHLRSVRQYAQSPRVTARDEVEGARAVLGRSPQGSASGAFAGMPKYPRRRSATQSRFCEYVANIRFTSARSRVKRPAHRGARDGVHHQPPKEPGGASRDSSAGRRLPHGRFTERVRSG